jgi:hypothetical protein
MPTNRTPLHRHPRHRLSFEQERSLEFGEYGGAPAFPSGAARREAWMRHRDHFLRYCRYGQRPQAWWDYEAPIPYPRDHDYRQAALWEAGLLSDQERKELEAEWREHFEKAQEPGFQYCIGHRKKGDTFASSLKGRHSARAAPAMDRGAPVPQQDNSQASGYNERAPGRGCFGVLVHFLGFTRAAGPLHPVDTARFWGRPPKRLRGIEILGDSIVSRVVRGRSVTSGGHQRSTRIWCRAAGRASSCLALRTAPRDHLNNKSEMPPVVQPRTGWVQTC